MAKQYDPTTGRFYEPDLKKTPKQPEPKQEPVVPYTPPIYPRTPAENIKAWTPKITKRPANERINGTNTIFDRIGEILGKNKRYVPGAPSISKPEDIQKYTDPSYVNENTWLPNSYGLNIYDINKLREKIERREVNDVNVLEWYYKNYIEPTREYSRKAYYDNFYSDETKEYLKDFVPKTDDPESQESKQSWITDIATDAELQEIVNRDIGDNPYDERVYSWNPFDIYEFASNEEYYGGILLEKLYASAELDKRKRLHDASTKYEGTILNNTGALSSNANKEINFLVSARNQGVIAFNMFLEKDDDAFTLAGKAYAIVEKWGVTPENTENVIETSNNPDIKAFRDYKEDWLKAYNEAHGFTIPASQAAYDKAYNDIIANAQETAIPLEETALTTYNQDLEFAAIKASYDMEWGRKKVFGGGDGYAIPISYGVDELEASNSTQKLSLDYYTYLKEMQGRTVSDQDDNTQVNSPLDAIRNYVTGIKLGSPVLNPSGLPASPDNLFAPGVRREAELFETRLLLQTRGATPFEWGVLSTIEPFMGLAQAQRYWETSKDGKLLLDESDQVLQEFREYIAGPDGPVKRLDSKDVTDEQINQFVYDKIYKYQGIPRATVDRYAANVIKDPNYTFTELKSDFSEWWFDRTWEPLVKLDVTTAMSNNLISAASVMDLEMMPIKIPLALTVPEAFGYSTTDESIAVFNNSKYSENPFQVRGEPDFDFGGYNAMLYRGVELTDEQRFMQQMMAPLNLFAEMGGPGTYARAGVNVSQALTAKSIAGDYSDIIEDSMNAVGSRVDFPEQQSVNLNTRLSPDVIENVQRINVPSVTGNVADFEARVTTNGKLNVDKFNEVLEVNGVDPKSLSDTDKAQLYNEVEGAISDKFNHKTEPSTIEEGLPGLHNKVADKLVELAKRQARRERMAYAKAAQDTGEDAWLTGTRKLDPDAVVGEESKLNNINENIKTKKRQIDNRGASSKLDVNKKYGGWDIQTEKLATNQSFQHTLMRYYNDKLRQTVKLATPTGVDDLLGRMRQIYEDFKEAFNLSNAQRTFVNNLSNGVSQALEKLPNLRNQLESMRRLEAIPETFEAVEKTYNVTALSMAPFGIPAFFSMAFVPSGLAKLVQQQHSARLLAHVVNNHVNLADANIIADGMRGDAIAAIAVEPEAIRPEEAGAIRTRTEENIKDITITEYNKLYEGLRAIRNQNAGAPSEAFIEMDKHLKAVQPSLKNGFDDLEALHKKTLDANDPKLHPEIKRVQEVLDQFVAETYKWMEDTEKIEMELATAKAKDEVLDSVRPAEFIAYLDEGSEVVADAVRMNREEFINDLVIPSFVEYIKDPTSQASQLNLEDFAQALTDTLTLVPIETLNSTYFKHLTTLPKTISDYIAETYKKVPEKLQQLLDAQAVKPKLADTRKLLKEAILLSITTVFKSNAGKYSGYFTPAEADAFYRTIWKSVQTNVLDFYVRATEAVIQYLRADIEAASKELEKTLNTLYMPLSRTSIVELELIKYLRGDEKSSLPAPDLMGAPPRPGILKTAFAEINKKFMDSHASSRRSVTVPRVNKTKLKGFTKGLETIERLVFPNKNDLLTTVVTNETLLNSLSEYVTALKHVQTVFSANRKLTSAQYKAIVEDVTLSYSRVQAILDNEISNLPQDGVFDHPLSKIKEALGDPYVLETLVKFKSAGQLIDITQTWYKNKLDNSYVWDSIQLESGWKYFARELTGGVGGFQTLPTIVLNGIAENWNSLPYDSLTDNAKEILKSIRRLQRLARKTNSTNDLLVNLQQLALEGTSHKAFNKDVDASVALILTETLQKYEHDFTDKFLSTDLDEFVDEYIANAEFTINEAQRDPEFHLTLDSFRKQLSQDKQFLAWLKKNPEQQKTWKTSLQQAHDAGADVDFLDTLLKYKGFTEGEGLPRFVIDTEWTGLKDDAELVQIGVRDMDDPTFRKVYKAKTVNGRPDRTYLAEHYDDNVRNFYKLLDPKNGYRSSTSMVSALLHDIQAQAGERFNIAKLVAHNGSKFDMGKLNSIINHRLFDPTKAIDTLTWMKEESGYFAFSLSDRAKIKEYFEIHQQNLMVENYSNRDFPDDARIMYGADASIREELQGLVDMLVYDYGETKESVGLIIDKDTGVVTASNSVKGSFRQNSRSAMNTGMELENIRSTIGYLQEMIKNVQTVTSDALNFNQILGTSLVNRSEVEGMSGTSFVGATLKDGAQPTIAYRKVTQFAEIYNHFNIPTSFNQATGKFDSFTIDSNQAITMYYIANAADGMAHALPKNSRAIAGLDIAGIIQNLKRNANHMSTTNVADVIRYLDPSKYSHFTNFTTIYQMAKIDPNVRAFLTDDFRYLLDNPSLMYSKSASDLDFGYSQKTVNNTVGISVAEYDAIVTDIRESADAVATKDKAVDLQHSLRNNPRVAMNVESSRATEAFVIEGRNILHNELAEAKGTVDEYNKAHETTGDAVIDRMEYLDDIKELPFAKYQRESFDAEASANLSQLYNLNEDQIISYLVYQGKSMPIVFDKAAVGNQPPPWKNVTVIETADDYFVMLQEAPTKLTTEEGTTYRYKNNDIERLADDTFTPVFYESRGRYIDYDKAKMKMYANFDFLSGGKARGTIFDTTNKTNAQDTYTMFPDEVKEANPVSEDFMFDDGQWDGIQFNHNNLGSLEGRKRYNAYTTEWEHVRAANSMREIIYNGDQSIQAAQVFFTDGIAIQIGSDVFANNTFPGLKGKALDNAISGYLKEHSEQRILALVQDPSKESGYRVEVIKNLNGKSIAIARKLNAIVVDNNTANTITGYLNNNIGGNTTSKLLSMTNGLYKKSVILTSGSAMRNALDNFIKLTGATDMNPIKAAGFMQEAAKQFHGYNSITRAIASNLSSADDFYKNFMKQVDAYFSGAKNPPMTRQAYENLHRVFMTDSFTNRAPAIEKLIDAESLDGSVSGELAYMKARLEKLLFSPLSYPENVMRLALYNYGHAAGRTTASVLQEIDDTFFKYNHDYSKQGGNRYANLARNLIFPWGNFFASNLKFWMQSLRTNPRMWTAIGGFIRWRYALDPMTPQEQEQYPERKFGRATMQLPMWLIPGLPKEMNGLMAKISPSWMSVFQVAQDPLNVLRGQFNSGIQGFLNTAEKKLFGDLHYVPSNPYMDATDPTGEQSRIPEEIAADPVKLALWNIASFIPAGQVIQNYSRNMGKLRDATGIAGLPPSLFSAPYNANIIDDFTTGVRTIQHLDPFGKETYTQHDVLVPNENPKDPSEYELNMYAEYSTVGGTTLMRLIDRNTGKSNYTQVYPTKYWQGENNDESLVDSGEMLYSKDYDGNPTGYWDTTPVAKDGTYTVTHHAMDGTIISSETRTREIIEYNLSGNPAVNVATLYLKKDEDGMLTGVKTYWQNTLRMEHSNNGPTQYITKGIAEDGTVVFTNVKEKTEGGTRYATYDMNGNLDKVQFFADRDLDYKSEVNNEGVTVLRGYDPITGELVNEQTYKEWYARMDENYYAKNRTTYGMLPEDAYDKTWHSISFYNPDTLTTTTYNLDGFFNYLGQRKETYNEETGQVDRVTYDKDGFISTAPDQWGNGEIYDFNPLEYFSKPPEARGGWRNFYHNYSWTPRFRQEWSQYARFTPNRYRGRWGLADTLGLRSQFNFYTGDIIRLRDHIKIGELKAAPPRMDTTISTQDYRSNLSSFYRDLWTLTGRPKPLMKLDMESNQQLLKNWWPFMRSAFTPTSTR